MPPATAAPKAIIWIRGLLCVLFVVRAARGVHAYSVLPDDIFFTTLAFVYALPGVLALVLAILAGRESRPVFVAHLLLTAGFLLWMGYSLLNNQIFFYDWVVLAQTTVPVALLVLLLLPKTRAFYRVS
ncbi:hypothetical protein F4561_001352 [Lipingzhangella halophila]|uniref:Uncharacterized protein n=1 Tax=Lipingzhangella halophila TaxID=1783352 RepID=A0A7W7REI3_9ACTN|nr:hypothetical protein [Lipingzhangella halophila]MBB4930532.1 hypothetical protein [Lipingzhangella halophila]